MALRIVFMGTPEFAAHAFAAVHGFAQKNDDEIVATYSRPPAKQGRGMKRVEAPVHQAAEAAGIEVLTPTGLKDEAALQAFRALKPDLAIVVAYGMILPQAFLDVPRLGCWNIHASLLPRWRGAAPIQRAIMAGDKETGVAIMQMQAGLDTGPVLLEKRLPITDEDTAASLHDKLAELGAEAIVAALTHAEKLTPTPQAADGITYAEKIDKSEAKLDFTRKAADLDRHIRGLSPFPGAWFEADGSRIKVLAARPLAVSGPLEASGLVGTVAGTVAASDVGNGAVIYCGDGALELLRVQKAGKPAMAAEAFLRGRGLTAGQKL